MFRFTIRDVLWLTVLAALGVTWWLDHRSSQRTIEGQAKQIAEQKSIARLAGNVRIENIPDVIILGSHTIPSNATTEDAQTINRPANKAKEQNASSSGADFDHMLRQAQDFNRGGGRTGGFGGTRPEGPAVSSPDR